MEPDHKELLIGLIGSTYGELKRLDDSIIGSSSTLARRSDQVKSEMMNVVKGIPSRPDVPILQAIHQQPPVAVPVIQQPQPQVPQPAPASQPTYIPQQAVAIPEVASPKVDDGQLEFDLNRKTRYEDIVAEIDRLYNKITKLEDKIDNLTLVVSEQKKKVG